MVYSHVMCVHDYWYICFIGAPYGQPKANEIISGDLIQVQLDADVFKMMQTVQHGGWNDRMAMVKFV